MKINVRMLLASCVMSVPLTALAQDAKPDAKPAVKPAPATPPAKPETPAEPPADTERTAEQQLFDAAAEAVKNAKAITYRASVAGTDGMKQAYPSSRVDLRSVRTTGGGFNGWLIRVTGTMERKDKDPQDVDIAWTPNSIEAIDTEKKELIEKAARQMSQAPGLQVANAARLKEVFAAVPFETERGLRARDTITYTVEGGKTIDGTECDVILVDRAGRKTRWALGKQDHFPRLYEQIMEGLISGTVRVDISGVSIETAEPPSVKPEDLRVPTREGFKEVRVGVAPAPVAPPAVAQKPLEAEKASVESAVIEAAAAPTPPVETPVVTGPISAPLFELKSSTGDTVKLADLKGKVVVVQFFGSWCLDCPAWIDRLSMTVKPLAAQGVEMLAVSFREKDDSNATGLLTHEDYGFKHLVKGEVVAKEFSARAFPATYVINREGVITASWQGETNEDAASAVADAVKAALATKV